MPKPKGRLKKFLYHCAYIGIKESIVFAFYGFRKQKIVRRVNVLGESVNLRTSTEDIYIAVSCLSGEEFSHIKISNPLFIVDAGANRGASAIYFAKRYPTSTVFAIEPEEDNYLLMLSNVQTYPNIKPIKAAIYGDEGVRTIFDRLTGTSGYTVSEIHEPQAMATGQQIACITVEKLFETYSLPRINILKLDIEGGEKSVFENSFAWIDKVDVIAVELHDRIHMGCDRAFYLATKDFVLFEKQGEKVTTYRKHPTDLRTET